MRRLFLLIALTPLCLGLMVPVSSLIRPLSDQGHFVALAATDPDEILEDPALETRARALAKELRCLVCQNQSIDDSDAELARDLRQIVRERLLAGDSDREIIDYVTARYGDFVLLRPPLKPSTWGLWYGPVGIFLIAAGGLGVFLNRRRQQAATPERQEPLSTDEQARLDRLLAGDTRTD